MPTAEIIVSSGAPDYYVFDKYETTEPAAIKDGYAFFKEVIKNRADWLISAYVERDFDDNLMGRIELLIGPKPFWNEEYLRQHGLGKYSYEAGSDE